MRELEDVALIEKLQLKGLVVDKLPNRPCLERRDPVYPGDTLDFIDLGLEIIRGRPPARPS